MQKVGTNENKMDTVKQVIVIRKDLNMRKGKMVAQGAHASMAAVLDEGSSQPSDNGPDCYVIPMSYEMEQWLEGLFTKICVSCNSEEELLNLYKQALEAGLHCSLIQDAGLTEFGGVPTYTAVGIGPGKASEIDKITGLLKLL